MSNTNNNSNPGHTKHFSPMLDPAIQSVCPCGNTINSPQHDRCVHCAKEIEDYEDLTWDEFWAEWDDTGEDQ